MLTDDADGRRPGARRRALSHASDTADGTDELYFPTYTMGGVPWEVPENCAPLVTDRADFADAKWNAQNHIARWSTPMLVIHGRRDYRIAESDAIGGARCDPASRLTPSVFNVLQSKGIPSRLVIFEVRRPAAGRADRAERRVSATRRLIPLTRAVIG